MKFNLKIFLFVFKNKFLNFYSVQLYKIKFYDIKFSEIKFFELKVYIKGI